MSLNFDVEPNNRGLCSAYVFRLLFNVRLVVACRAVDCFQAKPSVPVMALAKTACAQGALGSDERNLAGILTIPSMTGRGTRRIKAVQIHNATCHLQETCQHWRCSQTRSSVSAAERCHTTLHGSEADEQIPARFSKEATVKPSKTVVQRPVKIFTPARKEKATTSGTMARDTASPATVALTSLFFLQIPEPPCGTKLFASFFSKSTIDWPC